MGLDWGATGLGLAYSFIRVMFGTILCNGQKQPDIGCGNILLWFYPFIVCIRKTMLEHSLHLCSARVLMSTLTHRFTVGINRMARNKQN
jgi:hypothetical protein